MLMTRRGGLCSVGGCIRIIAEPARRALIEKGRASFREADLGAERVGRQYDYQ
jgi:hypothetical protein